MLNSVFFLLYGLVSTLISVHSQEQAPTGLTVRQVGTRSVRISWILPAQNSRSRSGYRISTSRDFSAGITVATDATHRLIDQAPGRVNYWLISLSTPSIMVGPVTGTIRDFNIPITVTFSPNTTSVTIFLAQPPYSLSTDKYRVKLRQVSGPRDPCQVIDSDHDSKIVIGPRVEFDNLMIFSTYSINFTALLLSGFNVTLRLTDTSREFTTLAAVPTDSPFEVNTPSITSRSFSISWTEIECTERNGLITNYTVEFQEEGGAVIPGVIVNRTFTASGLTPYTNYTFRVAGVNQAGTGPFSDTTSILTEEETPGPVFNLAGTHNFISIILTWNPPQEPYGVIISYEVTYTVDGSNTVRVNTSDLSTTFTIPSLTPQTRVSGIAVTAYTRIGRGEPANLRVETTFMAPSKVMNVSVEFLSYSSVRVSWESVNNIMIMNYIVYYSNDGAINESVIVPSSVNTVVIENLTESSLRFQVIATTEINGEVIMGERSDAVRSTMPPTIATAIATISDLTQESKITTPTETTTNGGIFAVVPVVIFGILVIIGIIFGFWLKRKKKRLHSKEKTEVYHKHY